MQQGRDLEIDNVGIFSRVDDLEDDAALITGDVEILVAFAAKRAHLPIDAVEVASDGGGIFRGKVWRLPGQRRQDGFGSLCH